MSCRFNQVWIYSANLLPLNLKHLIGIQARKRFCLIIHALILKKERRGVKTQAISL